MIIKINQTSSNLKNKFNITINNEIKYLAGTPWLKLDLPLNAENKRRSIMTDLNNNICYSTGYSITENKLNTAIPFKWLFTKGMKSSIYNIYDSNNNLCGKFYDYQTGFFATNYVIEFSNYKLNCYSISIGKTNNVSIYNGNTQIAEIVKPLQSFDNLDSYYIFLLDNYSNLTDIISFFTIYYDNIKYSNSGEVVKGTSDVKVEYTYSKNNKYYDENWIKNNFNQDEINSIYNEFETNRTKIKKDIKHKGKLTLIFFLIIWIIVFIIAYIMS